MRCAYFWCAAFIHIYIFFLSFFFVFEICVCPIVMPFLHSLPSSEIHANFSTFRTLWVPLEFSSHFRSIFFLLFSSYYAYLVCATCSRCLLLFIFIHVILCHFDECRWFWRLFIGLCIIFSWWNRQFFFRFGFFFIFALEYVCCISFYNIMLQNHKRKEKKRRKITNECERFFFLLFVTHKKCK